MLPSDFPPWQTVYGYFRHWRDNGTWQRIHRYLRHTNLNSGCTLTKKHASHIEETSEIAI
jgi:transposase